MPRTKGSKNRPKTNITKGYATQIAEKQETIASLNTEIASIQKAIEEQKNTLKEKKIALKKVEKEVATLDEYSCAMKSHFRKFGNQMSGSGNHLYNYASLLA